MNQKQPRSAISKATAKQVIVYFPKATVEALDRLAKTKDSDRSKLIRRAVNRMINAQPS